MAGQNELNSFVSKFFSLWSNGLEADLRVRCHNGYSFINLQTGLGYAKYDTGKYSPRRKKVKTRHDDTWQTTNYCSNDFVVEDTPYEDKTDHGCENVGVSIEDDILETQDENDSNIDVTTDSMMVSTDNEVQTDVAQNMEDNHDDIADVGGTSHDNENSDPSDHAHLVKIEENSKGENKSTPAPAAVGLQTSEENGIVELFATALFKYSPY